MRPLVCALSIFILPWPVFAAIVTIEFGGVVNPPSDNSILPTPGDSFDLLPPIEPGDIFFGSYSYDDSTPASERIPWQYDLDGARVELSINGVTFVFSEPPNPAAAWIQLQNHGKPWPDHYSFLWLGSKVGEDEYDTFTLNFYGKDRFADDAETMITSTDLTAVPDFSKGVGTVSFSLHTYVHYGNPEPGEPSESVFLVSGFGGTITSISVVPEPKLLLLVAVLALLASVRHYLVTQRTAPGQSAL